MGEVLLVYEIRPETVEVTPKILEEVVRSKLPEKVQMQDNPEEKPLFFGLTGIIGQFIIPEEDGAQDNLEEMLNCIGIKKNANSSNGYISKIHWTYNKITNILTSQKNLKILFICNAFN